MNAYISVNNIYIYTFLPQQSGLILDKITIIGRPL